jgi:LacI family transcriptional regulator
MTDLARGAKLPEPAVTLKDVARQAGVHPATASRALNPETRLLVSEGTAGRVLAAAAELGYHPNAVARSLRTRRSHTVGVLIPDLNNPLFPPMVRGLEDRLDADGYVALIGNTDGDDERERRVFEQMRARHVDGYALATAHLRNPMLDEAVRAGVPVVLMNRIAEDYSFPSVTVDNERGVRMAVSHLTSLGHRNIAGRVDRPGPVPRLSGGDGRRAAAGATGPGGLRPLVLHRGGPALRQGDPRRRRLHRGCGGQRHARCRLLPGAGRGRSQLSG